MYSSSLRTRSIRELSNGLLVLPQSNDVVLTSTLFTPTTTTLPLLMSADSLVLTGVNLTDLLLYEMLSLSCCQSSLSA